MRRVTTAGVETSALGFGCAPVMGSVGPVRARAAIRSALGEEITHFDVARSYGYGQAEVELARVLGTQRANCTIATKMGIIPRRGRRQVLALGTAARAARRVGVSRSVARAAAGRAMTIHPTHISPTLLATSLEASLRALGSDYVDFAFLHEPDIESLSDETWDLLRDLRAVGKARAVGISLDHVPQHDELTDLPADIVVQLPSSLAARGGAAATGAGLENVMTHSPFRGVEPAMRGASLGYALSLGLCVTTSMFSTEHIVQNAREASASATN